MGTQGRIRISIGVAVTCALGLGAMAPSSGAEIVLAPQSVLDQEKRVVGAMKVAPERPLDSNSLVVTWKTDRLPKSGWTYAIAAGSGDGFNCSSGVQRAIKPTWRRKGAVLRFTLRPEGVPQWCPSDARVLIGAVSRAGRFVTLAARTLTILDNSATPPLDPPGSNHQMAVQDGSAMTVRVPGRPDRSAPLSGSIGLRLLMFRGQVGRISRMEFLVKSVSLTAGALPTDPACTTNGRAFPSPIAVNARTSAFAWASTADSVPSAAPGATFPPAVAYLVLSFDEDPLVLTGCQGPAVAPLLRPLTLATQETGILGAGPVTLRGTLGGLKLSDGAEATIDVTLVLKTLPPPAVAAGRN